MLNDRDYRSRMRVIDVDDCIWHVSFLQHDLERKTLQTINLPPKETGAARRCYPYLRFGPDFNEAQNTDGRGSVNSINWRVL